ncbi:MAG TPA: ABC transporter substrate-binding protein, partial [Candidatus Binatia bacterium]
MIQTRTFVVDLLIVTALIVGLASDTQAQGRTKIRYALGDVVSIDELPLLIAVENAKKRGVDVEVTSFKNEDIATQAVINGQADVGQGTPYAAIQKLTVPIRFFYQLSALQFFPVVNKESYKGWKDLDGQEIAVQGRGSGTEAIMMLMAKEHGIKYKNVSYVPGSQVRALALIKGNIKATILDATNKNLVMKDAPDKFIILPLGNVKASDEALFATREFLDKNQAGIMIFLEELTKVNRAINANPKWVLEERKKLGLLKELPAKMEDEILPYFQEAVQNGVFPNDGGLANATKNDLEFYALSGALTG